MKIFNDKAEGRIFSVAGPKIGTRYRKLAMSSVVWRYIDPFDACDVTYLHHSVGWVRWWGRCL